MSSHKPARLMGNGALLRSVQTKLTNTAKAFLQTRCLLCLSTHTLLNKPICAPCHAQLPLYSDVRSQNSWRLSGCIICGVTIKSEVYSVMCGRCIEHAPNFDCCIAAAEYRWPVSALLNNYKSNANFAEGKLLSLLLSQRIEQHYQQRALPDCILPVPLHWRRKAYRGFNQSAETAKHLSRWLDIPIQTNLASRIKHTNDQKGLTRAARQRNIRGAFRIRNTNFVQSALKANWSNSPKHIAIVDDVVTTGATVNELSKTLRKAGSERIDVWCIARTDAESDTLTGTPY